ncbi:MAG: hypothetical protein RR949_07460, partial [Oscillospiraceae bacterium]
MVLMQNKLLTRIVSGILTASMLLSFFSGIVVPAAAETPTVPPVTDSEKPTTPEADASGGGEIPMPLVLDKPSIGFTLDQKELEVTATMTDLRYLGLTTEQYASLFPVGLDLSKAAYLDDATRSAVAGVDLQTRLANRADTFQKLDGNHQFVWEALYDQWDYSEYLTFQLQSWSVLEAREERAPQLTCTVLIRWTGPTTIAGLKDTVVPADPNAKGELTEEEVAA